MPQQFPSAPRAPRSVRAVAVVFSVIALAIAVRTTLTSLDWIGRVFPGFAVLDNRVVASIALPTWSGAAVAGIFQSQVVAVDGVAVSSRAEIDALVASRPAGTVLRYTLVKGGATREIALASQTFSSGDWLFLFGFFLLNGVVFGTVGIVVWRVSWQSDAARALAALFASWSVFMLTAMDLYGPSTFFRLHAGVEAIMPAFALWFALLFPNRHRHAGFARVGVVTSALALAVYEIGIYRPAIYSRMLEVNMALLGSVLVLLGLRLVVEYWRDPSQLLRARIRIVMIGGVVGLALPGAIGVLSALRGAVAINAGTLTPPLFALALAYATLKHDVFEIGAMVKRSAYYLLLTGAVGAAYVGAVALFNVVLRTGDVASSTAFPFLFTLGVLLVLNPLRTLLQRVVDRVFFRTQYDAAELLARAGSELGAALKRDEIAAIVHRTVEEATPNRTTRLFVAEMGSERIREIGTGTQLPAGMVESLSTGRTLTVHDPVELYDDESQQLGVRRELAAIGAEIAVPMKLRGDLTGALTVGPKESGAFYTAGDAELLRALVHQAAIALQNAASYEELAKLNLRLEQRVRDRTAQFEATNHELVQAYSELQSAQVQLVQSEKMASLGRLVAGVAHEINNPVSFIASNIGALRRRLERAAAGGAEAPRALAEAEELLGIMSRGAERTAAIVKDLRTFSRLGEARRKPTDLHDGIEVSLRLLEPRTRARVEIHRAFEGSCIVECDPGQMNQVFMNLLANACDAVGEGGNIWITTERRVSEVVVSIRDDGAGMTAEVLGRIFDPFFTTKEVGQGTGLGLAISHGVVAAHGGRIEVESTPGVGTTFRVILPANAADEAESPDVRLRATGGRAVG